MLYASSRALLAAAVLTCGLSIVGAREIAATAPAPFPNPARALSPANTSAQDRADLLNLIHFYSHLADGLHTDLFGEFFTEDAVFTILPFAPRGTSAEPVVWTGRTGIVEALRPNHEAFRRDDVQRRHFLTNPIVWAQTERDARVAVYLHLLSTKAGGPPSTVGTGRYEGRAVKTTDGWRMAEWTIYTDQRSEAP